MDIPTDSVFNSDAYNELNRFLDHSKYKGQSIFFNLGYEKVNDKDDSKWNLTPFLFNKSSIRLVLEVIGDLDLDGLKIMDVGCWRGGTISIIHKFFEPREVVGIDSSKSAIDFCQANYDLPVTSFICADINEFKASKQRFDVVIMIELMLFKPNIETVLKALERHLKDDGVLLLAGIFDAGLMDLTDEILFKYYSLGSSKSITDNVLMSCKKKVGIKSNIYSSFDCKELLDKVLITPNNPIFDGLAKGFFSYRVMRLIKK